jgi:hypothetical protein
MTTCSASTQFYPYTPANPAPPRGYTKFQTTIGAYEQATTTSGFSHYVINSSDDSNVVKVWPQDVEVFTGSTLAPGYTTALSSTTSTIRSQTYAIDSSNNANGCFCSSTSAGDPVSTTLGLSSALSASTFTSYADIVPISIGTFTTGPTSTNIPLKCANDPTVSTLINPFTDGIIGPSIGLSFSAATLWKTITTGNTTLTIDHTDPVLRWIYPQSQGLGTLTSAIDTKLGYPINVTSYGSINLDAWQCSGLQPLFTGDSGGNFSSNLAANSGYNMDSKISTVVGTTAYSLNAGDIYTNVFLTSIPNINTYMDLTVVLPNYGQSALVLGSVSLPDVAVKFGNNNNYGNLIALTKSIYYNDINLYYNPYLYPGYVLLVSSYPLMVGSTLIERSVVNAWGGPPARVTGSGVPSTLQPVDVAGDIKTTLKASSSGYIGVDYSNMPVSDNTSNPPAWVVNQPRSSGGNVYDYNRSLATSDTLPVNGKYTVPGLYMMRIALDETSNSSIANTGLKIMDYSNAISNAWAPNSELTGLIQNCFSDIHGAYSNIQTDVVYNILINILTQRVTTKFSADKKTITMTLTSGTLQNALGQMYMVAWTNPYNMSGKYTYVNHNTTGAANNVLYTALSLNEITKYANAFSKSSSSVTAFYGTMIVYIPYGYPGLNGSFGNYVKTNSIIINNPGAATPLTSYCSSDAAVASCAGTIITVQQYTGASTPNPTPVNYPCFQTPVATNSSTMTCVAAYWSNAYDFIFYFMGLPVPPPVTPGKTKIPIWAWIVIGVVGLILIIVIIWLIASPKKKRGPISRRAAVSHPYIPGGQEETIYV